MEVSKTDAKRMIRTMDAASAFIRQHSIKASDRNVARLLKLFSNKLKRKSNEIPNTLRKRD